MYKSQRGFTIPFISSIIGFFVAVSGAIFPGFFHKVEPTDPPTIEAATSTPIQTEPSEPVSVPVVPSKATTPATTKQKTSVSVKPTAAISTSTVQSTIQVVVSTSTPPVQIPAPVNPYKTSLDAIDAFLANQTPSSLVDLCTKAKSLPGRGSHEGLNGDKTAVIQIQNSLYSNIGLCEFVLGKSPASQPGKKYPFAWFAYSDSYILPPQTNSGDSDAMRITIIKDTDKYNEKIKSFIGSKMVYFASFSGIVSNDADVFLNIRPDDTAKMLLERIKSGAKGPQSEFDSFLRSFEPVEKTLNELKTAMRGD